LSYKLPVQPESGSPLLIAARLWASLSHLNRQLRAQRSGAGLSAAALATMARIHRDPGRTQSELAQAAGIRLQSLTRQLTDLEGAGLIRREADATDKRRSLLGLTVTGRQALKSEARRREVALAEAIAAALSPDEQLALLRACGLLDHVGDALSGRVEAPRSPAGHRNAARRPG
jgi:DNA-binding MarR family transcriptional regulator